MYNALIRKVAVIIKMLNNCIKDMHAVLRRVLVDSKNQVLGCFFVQNPSYFLQEKLDYINDMYIYIFF